MKTSLAIATLLLSSSLHAGASGCDAWTASLEEDEGGPRMTAAICAGTNPDDQAHMLAICGDGGEIFLRYLPSSAISYPPLDSDDYATTMHVVIDGKTHPRKAQFEAMDGAMAMESRIGTPFIDALMSGKQVTLSDTGGKVPEATFTLEGADHAFQTLINSCQH